MDGLEKITARISADADAEIQAIRDKAQAQAEELLADRELASRVLPVEKAFASLYRVDLSEKQAKMYQNGVKLDPKKTRCSHVEGDIAVYGPGGIFLGVSAVNRETGLLETKSLFALA